MPKPRIKCVAFDADHTLYSVNTRRAYDNEFAFLARTTGYSVASLRKTWLKIVDGVMQSRDPVKRSREYSLKKTLKVLGYPEKALDDRVEKGLKVFWNNVEITTNPFARETVEKLKKNRELTVALVSDEYRKHLNEKLSKAGIPKLDLIICPDDTGEMKPSTLFYENLLERTRARPDEILMVGDSWGRDLEPAKRLGIHTALFRKVEGNPDFFIDSLNEVIGIALGKTVLPPFFKTYDVRGVYPEPLNPGVALGLGKALGSKLPGKLNIVVARDNKPSSAKLEESLVKGLESTGADVWRVGVGPSDYASFATSSLEADFGVMVTASHLPPEYNGFKFLYGTGNGFLNEDLANLKAIYLKKSFRRGHGFSRQEDVTQHYLDHAEECFKMFFESLDARVVVDAGGGTGHAVVASLMERLGAEVVEVKKKRSFDCSEKENVAYLAKAVKKEKAGLAVAFDLDSDRIAVFDSNGQWVSGDELFCLADMMITREGDTVVASLDTSRMLEETSEGHVVYTRVGDPFVISEALRTEAVLAGEPNGHYCFPAFTNYNSGLFFSLLFAGMAPDIPEARSVLPRFFVERKKFETPSPGVKVLEITRKVGKEFEMLSLEDGVKFSTGNAVVLIRPSGTSRLVRMIVEAGDEKTARKTAESLSKKFF